MADRVRVKSRSPDEVRNSIEAKSERVRAAATQMTERIQRFEQWIGKMPGRTEAVYTTGHPSAHPDRDTYAFGIKLHRQDKEWIISYAEFEADDDEVPVNWKRLLEAPLKTKLFGIKLFPDLLVTIEESQDELVKEIEAAGSNFDQFAEALGLKGGE